MPLRFSNYGAHDGIQACVTQIQKAWFSSMGKFALYLRIAASREKRARERLLNESARVIQNSYLAYKWRIFLTSLFIYNRARRIQRSLKAFNLRSAVCKLIEARRDRNSRKIQYFYRKYSPLRKLYHRFERRKQLLIRQRHAVGRIVHAYRSHLIWKAYKRNRNHRYYDMLRNKAIILFQCAAFIQKNWRRYRHRFPYHIFCIMRRLAAERLQLEITTARKIQRWNRFYMPLHQERKRIERKLLENMKAAIIQKLAKAFLLKAEVFRRVEATFKRKTKARNIIAHNIRWRLLIRNWASRFELQNARAEIRRCIRNAASKIQRGLVKRHRDYYLPIRVAARFVFRRS